MIHRRALASLGRRLPRAGNRRFESSTSSSPKKAMPTPTPKKPNEDHLKWTEREEAPAWVRRMAPAKGGTTLPTPKEFAVIAVVAAAGYYAWFIDPPKEQDS